MPAGIQIDESDGQSKNALRSIIESRDPNSNVTTESKREPDKQYRESFLTL
jgi:hypothetical protein